MKKLICGLLTLLITVSCFVALSGCGAVSVGTKDMAGGVLKEEATEEYNVMTDSEDMAISQSTTSTPKASEDSAVSTNRKIIETIELSLQTKKFDELIENLNSEIDKLGGYIEASEIRGREMDSTDTRWATITVRIPAKKSKAFSKYISKNSVVVSRSVSTEDVTLQYVDMESRVSALEAEKTAFEKLLENAKKVEDIIAAREKLTEVIYEIESLKSQLRTYDNLVEYTTVTINIDEVERTAVVEEQTVWQEIGTNLKNNFSDLGSALVALFVFIVSAIPYLIPIGIIAAVTIVIIKLRNKRNNKIKSQPEKE